MQQLLYYSITVVQRWRRVRNSKGLPLLYFILRVRNSKQSSFIIA